MTAPAGKILPPRRAEIPCGGLSFKREGFMNVKQEVLICLINNYPVISNYKIARSSRKHPMSTMQRLRELRALGLVDYEYNRKTKCYTVKTKLSELRKILRGIRK